jgi:hypothetical protein
MVLAKDPWHYSVVYMDAEAFDIRLRPTSKFLLVQLLHVNCDVSVYQSTGQCLSFGAEFNFTAPYLIYIYILMHINKQIMNSNKEIYIVLKSAVVCYIIFLLLAALQSHL